MLADDDNDDIFLFKNALEELKMPNRFTVIQNGQELMHFLQNSEQLPDILFLDLNMPRKKGMACLQEIRENQNFKTLPVIIYTTSYQEDMVKLLYKKGAQYYIRKPIDFLQNIELIKKAIVAVQNLMVDQTGNFVPSSEENFVLF